MFGKLDSYMKKNEFKMFSNTMHKDKFKMGWRPKYKDGHCKTLGGKHRQNTLWHLSQQDFFFPIHSLE